MRERQFVADMVKDTYVPKMFRVKQTFPRPKIEPEEIPEIIENLLNQEKFASRVKPGMRIAITAGSRGIANNALTTKCIADFVKSRGAHPFVVPGHGKPWWRNCRRTEGDSYWLWNYRRIHWLPNHFIHGSKENRCK